MAGNFWTRLERPFFALAPMEDVTDTVFREIVLGVSDPRRLHVVCAEFASTDGLCHPEGREKVAQRLVVGPGERALLRARGVRLVAQIWGRDPARFREAAALIRRGHAFDGIDINFGCPVRKIVRQGGCSALIGEPELARQIVLATREGAGSTGDEAGWPDDALPVSVKTRTGLARPDTERWVATLLATGPAALILHGRTQKDMSKVPADWREIERAVRVRDAVAPGVPLVGNGDVSSVEDGLAKAARHGVDGLMVGRGIFDDPWFFNDAGSAPARSREERLALLQRHARLYVESWGEARSFAVLKKFFKIYCSGFPGAAALRARLMEAGTLAEVERTLDGWDGRGG